MSKSIEQLKETLIKEKKMYEEILSMVEEKTKVIVEGKVKELDEITKKEQQFIMKMGAFEKVRRSVLANIAEELDLHEPSSVSEILLFLEEEDVKVIDDLRDQLLEVISKLKEINKLNEGLIQQRLDYIHFSLDLLTNQEKDGNNYNKQASEKEKTKVNLFDMRV